MRFVIVTGMSGAGKSTALKMLEDMGYFCVDNLPIAMFPGFDKYLVVLNIGKRHTRRGSCCNNCCQICIISQFYIKLITQLVLDDMACSKFLKAELLTVCATAFL